jgi:hypothetical protein
LDRTAHSPNGNTCRGSLDRPTQANAKISTQQRLREKEMRIAWTAAAVIALLSAFAFSPVSAAPEIANALSYCAKHPHYDEPGEEAKEDRPYDVQRVNNFSVYWRCQAGRALVCEGSASGDPCLKSDAMVARRRAAFRQFRNQNPNNDFIPHALTMGLHTDWRCAGVTPVRIGGPARNDAHGFLVGAWRPLR